MYGEMPQHAWVFKASWFKIIDGDTVDVEVDAGFRNYRMERLRLLGVNAPERKGETTDAARAATEWVREWLITADDKSHPNEQHSLVIRTSKSDAFGRFLAVVWRISDGRCLNDDIVSAGHAVVDVRAMPPRGQP